MATTRFAAMALEAARGEGLSGVRIATVAHPIGGIDDAALGARAEEAVDAIVAIFGER